MAEPEERRLAKDPSALDQMTCIHRPATRHHPIPHHLDITMARLLRTAMALDGTPR